MFASYSYSFACLLVGAKDAVSASGSILKKNILIATSVVVGWTSVPSTSFCRGNRL